VGKAQREGLLVYRFVIPNHRLRKGFDILVVTLVQRLLGGYPRLIFIIDQVTKRVSLSHVSDASADVRELDTGL
jgi:hypothetical protein